MAEDVDLCHDGHRLVIYKSWWFMGCHDITTISWRHSSGNTTRDGDAPLNFLNTSRPNQHIHHHQTHSTNTNFFLAPPALARKYNEKRSSHHLEAV